jgi:hypothetical protein
VYDPGPFDMATALISCISMPLVSHRYLIEGTRYSEWDLLLCMLWLDTKFPASWMAMDDVGVLVSMLNIIAMYFLILGQ